jgi:CRISPR-associated protein Cas1
VLYVTLDNGYVHVDGDTVAVMVGNETKGRFPGHLLESIVCFGNTTVSTPLIAYCGERGISLAFFSEFGRFMGRVEGPIRGNVLLRTRQYAVIGDETLSAAIASAIVLAKIANCRAILLRAARESGEKRQHQAGRLHDAAAKLGTLTELITDTTSLDTIRGVEGIAAQTYFSVFQDMIRVNTDLFDFRGRSRRPPQDPVNAVLSFLYALLAHDYRSALEGVGLDPYAGFLHALRPGRPSLALDMMEELRAPLCDRLALSLINLRMLSDTDFTATPTGVFLNDKGRKQVLSSWQSRKRETISHDFLHETPPIGLLSHLQSQLMARYIRGDLESYPPFLWR